MEFTYVLERIDHALWEFLFIADGTRLAVGDVLCALRERRAPEPIQQFFLQASLRLGVDATVNAALSEAASALAALSCERVEDLQREIAMLRRVADAALLVRGETNRKKLKAETLVRIPHLLQVAGLQEIGQITLQKEPSTSELAALVDLAASCLAPNAGASERSLSTKSAAKAAKISRNRIFGTIVVTLRAVAGAKTSSVFSIIRGKDANSIYKFLPCGGVSLSSPGALLDSQGRVVVESRAARVVVYAAPR